MSRAEKVARRKRRKQLRAQAAERVCEVCVGLVVVGFDEQCPVCGLSEADRAKYPPLSGSDAQA